MRDVVETLMAQLAANHYNNNDNKRSNGKSPQKKVRQLVERDHKGTTDFEFGENTLDSALGYCSLT